jgi:hypothetical protein
MMMMEPLSNLCKPLPLSSIIYPTSIKQPSISLPTSVVEEGHDDAFNSSNAFSGTLTFCKYIDCYKSITVETRSKKERDDGAFIQPLPAAAFTIIYHHYPTSINQPASLQSVFRRSSWKKVMLLIALRSILHFLVL